MHSNVENIEEYYKSFGGSLDISLEEFKLICNSPFKMVKRVMSSGELEKIRLQYLCSFEVSAPRVKYSKKTLEENYTKGLISKDRYDKRMKTLSNYET